MNGVVHFCVMPDACVTMYGAVWGTGIMADGQAVRHKSGCLQLLYCLFYKTPWLSSAL